MDTEILRMIGIGIIIFVLVVMLIMMVVIPWDYMRHLAYEKTTGNEVDYWIWFLDESIVKDYRDGKVLNVNLGEH